MSYFLRKQIYKEYTFKKAVDVLKPFPVIKKILRKGWTKKFVNKLNEKTIIL